MKRLLALLCALLISSAADGIIVINSYRFAVAGANRVLNPGFEVYTGTQDDSTLDAVTSWTVDDYANGYVDSTATGHSGSAAIRIRSGAGGEFEGVWQDGIAVTPAENLTLRFWCKNDGSADAYAYYAVYDLTNAAYIVGPSATGVASTNYTEVVAPFTVPSGCTSIRVYFYTDLFAARDVWLDDVSLQ